MERKFAQHTGKLDATLIKSPLCVVWKFSGVASGTSLHIWGRLSVHVLNGANKGIDHPRTPPKPLNNAQTRGSLALKCWHTLGI